MPITKYLWDGDNILAETDGNDTVTTVYTNEPQQYGNLVSQRSGTATSYFHFDALGSARQLTNAAGVVTDTFTYNAWGEEVARTGTTATPFRWVGALGYYWDSDRQLYYIRRRSYSGPLGRWIAVDPLFTWIGTVQKRSGYSAHGEPHFDATRNTQKQFMTHFILNTALDPYDYTSSRPLTLTDPSGLLADWKQCDCRKLLRINPKIGELIKCAEKKDCLSRIDCHSDCPKDLFGSYVAVGLGGVIHLCYASWNTANLSVAEVLAVIREELYHALTLCHHGLTSHTQHPSLIDVYQTIEGSGLSGPQMDNAKCLADEMLAKYCAGACTSYFSCRTEAALSCPSPLSLIPIDPILSAWFSHPFLGVPQACKDIDADCGI